MKNTFSERFIKGMNANFDLEEVSFEQDEISFRVNDSRIVAKVNNNNLEFTLSLSTSLKVEDLRKNADTLTKLADFKGVAEEYFEQEKTPE